MNTIKFTTIATTALIGSFLVSNRPIKVSLSPVGKQIVSAKAESTPRVVRIADNQLKETQANAKQQESIKKELGVLNFKKSAAPGIVFRIQILSAKQAIPADAKIFSGISEIREYYYNGQYKYTVGGFRSPFGTEPMFRALSDKGFPDAFMVAFKDDFPIPLKMAMEAIRE